MANCRFVLRTQLKRGASLREKKKKKKETEEPYNRRRLAERAEGRSYEAINTQYKETRKETGVQTEGPGSERICQ